MRVVMYSGGATSWATAKRVAAAHGTADLVLLFADTRIEDDDLYRFLAEASASIGVPVTRIAEGRTPEQVFIDVSFLGNARIAPCSRVLKQEPSRKWVEANCTVEDTTLYIGYDWTEPHRVEATRKAWEPWRVEFPLCERPYLYKHQHIDAMRSEGLTVSALYDEGFSHNNCGGMCVRGGQGHFARLYHQRPERYAEAEAMEGRVREKLGDVTILKDRAGGETKPLTLRAFREGIEAGMSVDMFDVGACACFDATPGALATSGGEA